MIGAMIGAIFGAVFSAVGSIVYLSVLLLWFVLTVIARWMVFIKAGQPGWKSVIPIYSDYISYRIAWTANMFWFYLIFYFAGNMLEDSSIGIIAAAGTLCQAATVLIALFYSLNLAKSFGKGTAFAIGLWIFEPLFTLILGFGSAQYQKRYW